MSATWWTHRTKTGRVVYNRKKNPFGWCDVSRIVGALYERLEYPGTLDLDDRSTWRRTECFILVVLTTTKMVIETSHKWPETVADPAAALFSALDKFYFELGDEYQRRREEHRYGGGEFGGGGSSRPFPSPAPGNDPRPWWEQWLKPFEPNPEA